MLPQWHARGGAISVIHKLEPDTAKSYRKRIDALRKENESDRKN
jgi:hypothetical protein